jgi:hypothetical protein
MAKSKKDIDPDIIQFVLNKGREIGYLEAIKELYRQGYHIDDIKLIKYHDLIRGKLEKECRRKNLLKRNDRKKINY